MRHLYECPMRWADLDVLNHVNNVVYLDYLQEARVDMLRTHAPAPAAALAGARPGEGLVVASHDITYLRSLHLRPRPVSIECWVTQVRAASFTMAYEIFDEVDGERTVYARATTLLTPFVFAEDRPRRLTDDERQALAVYLEPAPPSQALAVREAGDDGTPEPASRYPLRTRFSDVDVYGHVNNVKYVEYFQEARVALMGRLAAEVEDEGVVVMLVRTQVDYRQPILFRSEPYEVLTRVNRIGSRSVTLESEILDGDRLMSRARVVLVYVDPVSGRSVEPPPALRSRLEQLAGR